VGKSRQVGAARVVHHAVDVNKESQDGKKKINLDGQIQAESQVKSCSSWIIPFLSPSDATFICGGRPREPGSRSKSWRTTLETFSALSKSGSSLLKFSSTLSFVSVGLTLLTTFMDESKEEGLVAAFTALAEMIREGFQNVLDTLHRIAIHLYARFDRLEKILDRRIYNLELGILEMLHQIKFYS